MHSFLPPASNRRLESDPYSGYSFETRTKLLLEIVKLTQSLIPGTTPLFVRISGSDFLNYEGCEFEDSWKISDTARLAPLLEEAGVDLLDISGGALHHWSAEISVSDGTSGEERTEEGREGYDVRWDSRRYQDWRTSDEAT